MFALRIAPVMRRIPTQPRKLRVWRDRLYEAIGAAGWDENETVDSRFPSELQHVRLHNGMMVALDLTDWCQRRTFFTGRYYQEDLEELFSRLLRPGSSFVDIGANIGMTTLHAASIVGNDFWTFEPNPEVYARLVQHVRMNGLRGQLFNWALGSEPNSLPIKIYGRHTGKGTLVDQDGPALATINVDIRRGDEALIELDTSKPTLIKIDVEGFEVQVLEGLGKILDGNVAVITEVSRKWLQRAGTSAEQLHSVLKEHGLSPHSFELVETPTTRKLVVKSIDGPLARDQYDCLFVRSGSVFSERLGQGPRPRA